jgi:hypothetical protein
MFTLLWMPLRFSGLIVFLHFGSLEESKANPALRRTWKVRAYDRTGISHGDRYSSTHLTII